MLKIVNLILKKGKGKARAEGNNAAWICPCGKEPLPLLSTTRKDASDTQCPSCHRVFRAISRSGGPGKPVVEVREI